MTKTIRSGRVSLRIDEGNPNHHLYRNNGIWWIHYTSCPTPQTAQRVRRSLGTKDVKVARQRRDACLAHLVAPPSEAIVEGAEG